MRQAVAAFASGGVAELARRAGCGEFLGAANMERSDRLPRTGAVATLSVIAAGYVVNAMDRLVFPTLLPTLATEYGFTLLAAGLQANIFTFGFGIAGIPGGFSCAKASAAPCVDSSNLDASRATISFLSGVP